MKKKEDILIIEVETKNHFLSNQDYWYFFAIFLTPRVSIKLGLDCVAFVIILFSSYSFSLSLDKMLKKKTKSKNNNKSYLLVCLSEVTSFLRVEISNFLTPMVSFNI